ncbi:MAG TPA: transposase [Anaerolineae bacterium]|nr:transposase [Anaerolineae bacterium]
MTAHHPRREDPEYRRQGSANLFLTVAPHLGWRQVRVSERRTQRDFAHAMRTLVDEDFPEADRIIVVRDHLNTHQRSSLYPTFPPAEAHRLARKLEFRFTPIHGSWLNLAEIELSALSRQGLARRLPDQATLTQEVDAWVAERNALASGSTGSSPAPRHAFGWRTSIPCTNRTQSQ